MIHQFPVRRLSKDEGSQTFHDQRSSSSPLTESLNDTRFDTVDVCTTQLWFPPQFESWNGFPDWSHDSSTLVNETWPYQYQDQSYSGTTNAWTPPFTDSRTNSSGSVHSPFFESLPFNRDPDPNRAEHLNSSQVASPQVKTQHMYLPQGDLRSQDKTKGLSISQYHGDIRNRLLDSDWMGFSPRNIVHRTSHPVHDTKPELTSPNSVSPNLAPEWLSYNQVIPEIPTSSTDTTSPVSKRKHASPGPPPTKKSRQSNPQAKLAEYVGVFENEPGALTTVKKRKKLDGAVRKAAQDVRKAGACHQCRFRKRTVSLDPLRSGV
jgi:hypothetical protein